MEPISSKVNPLVYNEWFSEDFIYNSVVVYLKENGYKVQKEQPKKDGAKAERVINASKFFKKEMIEVKGYPLHYSDDAVPMPAKATHHAKSWFSEALVDSFVNFGSFENAEVAMALPNVGRYQAIVEKLHEYFTINDLNFRIYLVNEDGSIELSNLNEKLVANKHLFQ